jgi:membrane-associated phospholipid phosphatase
MTLYGAIALIVHAQVHGRWRTVALVVPVVLGLLVAVGRLYRGVHYPTDVIASALLAVTWLAVTYALLLRRRAA